MKVLHISTSDSGGAGIASLRLHKALNATGTIQSHFLHLYGNQSTSTTTRYSQFTPSFWKRILMKFNFYKTQSEKNRLVYKQLNLKVSFSCSSTDYAKLHEHYLIQEADIIHLHWVSSFVDLYSFLKNVKKPIVWTMHDKNPFLGGYHYECDKKEGDVLAERINNEIRSKKFFLYKAHGNITWISPSGWLQKSAISRGLEDYGAVKHIPNLVPPVFKPLENSEYGKDLFGIKKNLLTIMFIAEDIMNYRKGIHLLLPALNVLNNQVQFQILLVGGIENTDVFNGLNIVTVGKISDERLMCVAINSCDILILPSLEDNLPNVMLEAMACGKPVVAFKDGGGAAEVIREGLNGFLIHETSTKSLTKVLMRVIKNKDEIKAPLEIRNSVLEYAKPDDVVQEHIRVYKMVSQL